MIYFHKRSALSKIQKLVYFHGRPSLGGEGRQSGDVLTFADGFTDGIIPSVILSAILTVKKARHRTELPF
jgi:hypothetical protein